MMATFLAPLSGSSLIASKKHAFSSGVASVIKLIAPTVMSASPITIINAVRNPFAMVVVLAFEYILSCRCLRVRPETFCDVRSCASVCLLAVAYIA